jgi:hypothetical protein
MGLFSVFKKFKKKIMIIRIESSKLCWVEKDTNDIRKKTDKQKKILREKLSFLLEK